MAIIWRPNPQFEQQAKAEGWPTDAAMRAAHEVRALAQGYARDSRYARTLRVRRTREGAWVGTDYWFAHLDEWGSSNNPPTGALRRAVRQTGLHFRESRR